MKRFFLLFSASLFILTAACGNEYPADQEGRRISGRIFYDGVIDDTLIAPAIGVLILSTPPLEMGIPNGTQIFADPGQVPAEGLEYEIRNLDPFEYSVFAAVIDLDDPDYSPTTIGAWPNVCSLMVVPVKAEVTAHTPLRDMDITLYDNMGFTDPCFTEL